MEGLDLPLSEFEDEELSESIIVDNNGGQPIVIDSSDEEMDNDTPRRRAQRKRVSSQSPDMVNWTSEEYKARSAARLTAAWEEVWKHWGSIYTKSDRQLAQNLDRFSDVMSDVWRCELWNEKYRRNDGRRVYDAWQTYRKRVRKGGLVRAFGKALKRLQEVEEEYQSIAVTMDDGDSEDSDYVPTQTRRHR